MKYKWRNINTRNASCNILRTNTLWTENITNNKLVISLIKHINMYNQW